MRKANVEFIVLAMVLTITQEITFAQEPAKSGPDVVAGILVNYNESKVGTYTLPDPLTKLNGEKVKNADDWIMNRRPEILKMFETQQYGKVPGRPTDMIFNVFDKGTTTLDGKAIRKQVTIYLTKDTASAHKIDLLIYLPAHAVKPVPLLLNISFSTNNNAVDDPGVKPGMIWTKEGARIPAPPGRFRKVDVTPFIDAGFGFATFCYTDIEPDQLNGISYGIRSVYLKPGQTSFDPDEWGAISAWSWGLSRVMDYFETDKNIDAEHIALTGASRLGKTVIWTGARDPRFALVIGSVSGEGGAALSRRNYGETIAHITAPTRYAYQFAINYAQYGQDPNKMPMDSHMLIALMAPRPVLLQTGSTDRWSDPKGEWEAALAAKSVFELFGQTGPTTNAWPQPGDESQMLHNLGYFMHDGPHGVMPADWPRFIEYMKKYL
jgi:(4-O-methyl)-D-glucuronate---lignin esterase